MLLRLQVIVLSSSKQFSSPERSLDLPTTFYHQVHIPELDDVWLLASYKRLLDMNLIWEARSVLSLCLHHTSINQEILLDYVWRHSDLMLKNDDTMAMLADCGKRSLPFQRILPKADLQGLPQPKEGLSKARHSTGTQRGLESRVPDTSGQGAPPGMEPRVTATLWEEEGIRCFQVVAHGVCVSRREDNHMINGTKLLNVAGITRHRRDGILKSEKNRHVVKIGPVHLKGVW